jgi:CBS domain-containing protein
MATVQRILDKKGSVTWSVSPDASVLQAAMLMNEHQIGALVVTEEGGIVGMFTERDILRRVVGEQRDPAQTRVREVMSHEVVCCRPETMIDEARAAMMNRRIRHLPVVDGAGRLLGLISIGDLNAFDLAAQEHTIYMLHEYLYGRV